MTLTEINARLEPVSRRAVAHDSKEVPRRSFSATNGRSSDFTEQTKSWVKAKDFSILIRRSSELPNSSADGAGAFHWATKRSIADTPAAGGCELVDGGCCAGADARLGLEDAGTLDAWSCGWVWGSDGFCTAGRGNPNEGGGSTLDRLMIHSPG
jgi:hypothetical protein